MPTTLVRATRLSRSRGFATGIILLGSSVSPPAAYGEPISIRDRGIGDARSVVQLLAP